MSAFSLWHWIIVLAVFGLATNAIFVWFVAQILRKAGFSRWWALLYLLPGINALGTWAFAFLPWPGLRRNQSN